MKGSKSPRDFHKLDLVNRQLFSSMREFDLVKDAVKGKSQIGIGSFGSVSLVQHKNTGVKYAIKMINTREMKSVDELQGVEREVRVHSELNHPHIIQFFDCFQEEGVVFIVLEYASNGNLFSLLFKRKLFSEVEAYKYFSQTCDAIRYLHSINIVHRDLKPENILLDANMNVKLCDFGWCIQDIENPRSTFCGTYEYMAPEIVFRQTYDYRIDVWALGVLIYELLHGCAPFKGKTFNEVQKKIEKGDVKFSESVSQTAKYLICKVLQANPSKRISIDDITSHAWMIAMSKVSKQQTAPSLSKKDSQVQEKEIIFVVPYQDQIEVTGTTPSNSQTNSVQNAKGNSSTAISGVSSLRQDNYLSNGENSKNEQSLFTESSASVTPNEVKQQKEPSLSTQKAKELQIKQLTHHLDSYLPALSSVQQVLLVQKQQQQLQETNKEHTEQKTSKVRVAQIPPTLASLLQAQRHLSQQTRNTELSEQLQLSNEQDQQQVRQLQSLEQVTTEKVYTQEIKETSVQPQLSHINASIQLKHQSISHQDSVSTSSKTPINQQNNFHPIDSQRGKSPLGRTGISTETYFQSSPNIGGGAGGAGGGGGGIAAAAAQLQITSNTGDKTAAAVQGTIITSSSMNQFQRHPLAARSLLGAFSAGLRTPISGSSIPTSAELSLERRSRISNGRSFLDQQASLANLSYARAQFQSIETAAASGFHSNSFNSNNNSFLRDRSSNNLDQGCQQVSQSSTSNSLQRFVVAQISLGSASKQLGSNFVSHIPPLSDKTNRSIFAVPTKQINLLDDRKRQAKKTQKSLHLEAQNSQVSSSSTFNLDFKRDEVRNARSDSNSRGDLSLLGKERSWTASDSSNLLDQRVATRKEAIFTPNEKRELSYERKVSSSYTGNSLLSSKHNSSGGGSIFGGIDSVIASARRDASIERTNNFGQLFNSREQSDRQDNSFSSTNRQGQRARTQLFEPIGAAIQPAPTQAALQMIDAAYNGRSQFRFETNSRINDREGVDTGDTSSRTRGSQDKQSVFGTAINGKRFQYKIFEGKAQSSTPHQQQQLSWQSPQTNNIISSNHSDATSRRSRQIETSASSIAIFKAANF